VKELVEAFVDAWERQDVDALRTLLAEDAAFSMPPWPIWWRGRETLIALAQAGSDVCPPARSLLTHANGQVAIAYYSLQAAAGRYVASALDVVTLEGESIAGITGFVTPEIFPSFGLPTELSA